MMLKHLGIFGVIAGCLFAIAMAMGGCDETRQMVAPIVTDNGGGDTMMPPVEPNVDDVAEVLPVMPAVLAISGNPETINPDSGAPQGRLTLNATTPERTTSPITSVRFEAKRSGDAAWRTIGTANAATGQEWSAAVDTYALEDTITAESPAARDVSMDSNPYTVRAIAIANGTEYASSATATFSVDNVDDVAPVGPTAILLVEDVAGEIIPDEAGAYTVGGIVDDSVDAPVATFTLQPAAAPNTYALVQLVQTAEDGTVTEIDGYAGAWKITVDVGALENAAYNFHALAMDAAGNVQTDASPKTTVNVRNFRKEDVSDVAVTAVDGRSVENPESPPAAHDSITISLTVANGTVAASELSVTINGTAAESAATEEQGHTFSLTVDVSTLPDGKYTPHAVVTQRNGSVSIELPTITVAP